MEKMIIVNGSPRAAVSNSKKLIEIFKNINSKKFNITEFVCRRDNDKICAEFENTDNVLFVFPLYTDGVPSILLQLFKDIEKAEIKNKPKINVIINCGFMEPFQNDTAVEIIKIFSEQCGFEFGSVLCIGSGEAIMDTPFKLFVNMKIKSFSKAIVKNSKKTFKVTMPITKSMFLKASTSYWLKKGEKFGVSREKMDTMDIEK